MGVIMRAMVLRDPGVPPGLPGRGPLSLEELPEPRPGPGQVRLRVLACGICRTDLHIVDRELSRPALPLVPGHQVVGEVVELGEGVEELALGQVVGVPWLGWTCGRCAFCEAGQENLCDQARFTGYHFDGGLAEQCKADARYCFPIPTGCEAALAAPLLCAGLIGYRCLRLADEIRGSVQHVGLYGFGAAAHILSQLLAWQGRSAYALTRPGDVEAQAFARRMGAVWAGGSDQAPPRPLDAAIIFAPVGALVPEALRRVRKGGTVVCGGIHMSEIPAFSYELLWGERVLRSVANLTRQDGIDFLALVPRVPIHTQVRRYPLEETNQALEDLRHGRFTGAAVVVP